VKLRGFRIELDEIEAALASHEAIDEAAVVLMTDDDEKSLAGAWTLRSNVDAPSPDVLQSYLMKRLPHYAVPSHLIRIDAFPRTSTEKIDRRTLGELLHTKMKTEDLYER
jgi:acyl-coenzyme A synthetase/AMP-(fatty) acid ligase